MQKTDPVSKAPALGTPLPHGWGKAGWWAWLAVALLSVGIFAATLPANYRLLGIPCTGANCSFQLTTTLYQGLLSQGFSAHFFPNLIIALSILAAMIFAVIAFLIHSRRSNTWIGFLGPLALVSFGFVTLSSNPTVIASLPVPFNLIGTLLDYLGLTLMILFLYIVPDGRLYPRWAYIPVVIMTLALAPQFFQPSPAVGLRSWGWKQTDWVQILIWLVALGPLVFVQYYRYRHVYTSEQRSQAKWMIYGVMITILGFLLLSLVPVLFPSEVQNVWVFLTSIVVIYLLMLLIPISIGIAVLRHGLWDIDLLINRTLVYVPLTGILGGLYSSSIALFQRIFTSITGEKSDAAIVISTLILASAFTPIKNGLQSAVDKRFKEPDSQFRELKAFGREVQTVVEVLTLSKLISRLLDACLSTFQASSGAVFLNEDGESKLIHATSNWKEEDALLICPIELEGQRLALLKLGPRAKKAPYGAREMRILRQVSGQIAEAIKLTEGKRW